MEYTFNRISYLEKSLHIFYIYIFYTHVQTSVYMDTEKCLNKNTAVVILQLQDYDSLNFLPFEFLNFWIFLWQAWILILKIINAWEKPLCNCKGTVRIFCKINNKT